MFYNETKNWNTTFIKNFKIDIPMNEGNSSEINSDTLNLDEIHADIRELMVPELDNGKFFVF